MKLLHKPNTEGYVDLYYNDIHGLKATYSDLRRWKTEDEIMIEVVSKKNIQGKDVANFHKVYSLEFALFHLEFQR